VPGAFCTSFNERNWNERSLERHDGRSIRQSRLCACFDRWKLRWHERDLPLIAQRLITGVPRFWFDSEIISQPPSRLCINVGSVLCFPHLQSLLFA